MESDTASSKDQGKDQNPTHLVSLLQIKAKARNLLGPGDDMQVAISNKQP